MSGKLDATASGDMTGSGTKPAKEVKMARKYVDAVKNGGKATDGRVDDDCSAALVENIGEKAREALQYWRGCRRQDLKLFHSTTHDGLQTTRAFSDGSFVRYIG